MSSFGIVSKVALFHGFTFNAKLAHKTINIYAVNMLTRLLKVRDKQLFPGSLHSSRCFSHQNVFFFFYSEAQNATDQYLIK